MSNIEKLGATVEATERLAAEVARCRPDIARRS